MGVRAGYGSGTMMRPPQTATTAHLLTGCWTLWRRYGKPASKVPTVLCSSGPGGAGESTTRFGRLIFKGLFRSDKEMGRKF
jgi:hypothetical protein